MYSVLIPLKKELYLNILAGCVGGAVLGLLGTKIYMPHEVDLSDIVRTFYGIDKRYLALIEELPAKELEFAAQFSDIVRSQVSHPLSPNLPVTLADHISFAIKRAREHMCIASILVRWKIPRFVIDRPRA